jgi:eukaryotic-like serine/threonine-protein kinase
MDFKRQVDIGRVALSRGLLSVEAFADAMIELGMLSEQGVSDSMWLDKGRLDEAELASVIAALHAPSLPDVRAGLGSAEREIGARPHPPAGTTRRATQRGVSPVVSGELPPLSAATGGTRQRYVKVGVLGTGGVGEVEERRDSVLGRSVALKSVRLDAPERELALTLLEREARVTGSLEHPNIVPVYDMGVDPVVGAYYVMRIAKQASLADVLDRVAQRDGATLAEFALPRLLRVFVQVCNAIEYAHSRGYAHRDLKPANVLLGTYGEVLVVDWGLAHPLGERPAIFGGTPGYMPLEQLSDRGAVDARSDVFSLGVILFEMLCQRPAFSHETAEDLKAAYSDPTTGYALTAPSKHRTPWPVPEELEEICLKALRLDPADRHQSARQLADAIEDFLAGTREQERRRRKADALVATGDDLRASYDELMRERPARVEEFLSLREQIPPWEPEERKRPLWDAEEQFAVLETLSVRTMQAVITSYEQALDEVPTHEGARRGLTDLYSAELRRAEDRRDNADRVYFEERIRQITDDVRRPDALVDLDTAGVIADVQVLDLVEDRRRLVPVEGRSLGPTPLRRVALAPGSCILRLSRPGHRAVDYPILLRSEADLSISVDLVASAELADDEVLVPGGPALLGGDDDVRLMREPFVSTFIIQRDPVTFAQYLHFVGDVYGTHPSLAENYLPLSDEGSPYWTWTGGRFRPGRILRWGRDPAALLRLPVVGIDAWSAEAYANWRSRRTGRVFRLPTEDEWEKAARGVDGRRYPWGDGFDPSFARMSASRATIPAPEPSGTFPVDVSVYGVRDMAGGVADWVLAAREDARDEDAARRMVTRGGAFCDPQLDCRLASRRPALAMERASRLGFRLARTPAGRAPSIRVKAAAVSMRPDPRAE